MDAAAVRPRLGEVRTEELRRSCAILGVDRQEFLGYRDSGMAGAPSNNDPRAFHAAPLDEAARRVATVMREERPDVVVTYTADGTYWHPDHVKAHSTTVAALDLLRDEGWSPAKFYMHAVPRSAVEGIERRARDAGLGCPSRSDRSSESPTMRSPPPWTFRRFSKRSAQRFTPTSASTSPTAHSRPSPRRSSKRPLGPSDSSSREVRWAGRDQSAACSRGSPDCSAGQRVSVTLVNPVGASGSRCRARAADNAIC